MARGFALVLGTALMVGGCATVPGAPAIQLPQSAVVESEAALKRIAASDDQGPEYRAVIATNPDAMNQAMAVDANAIKSRTVKPLHGVPILIKDNIETADAMATTAGSLALKDNVTRRDAPLVKRLRDAGAIIIGKTNLSEWANIRADESTSGWSAVGGLTKNPHGKPGELLNACGSSSGSGAAVAAGYVNAAIGTETDGSIICPASSNGVVGMKPTVGLVSRTHVVPISASQDTAGPMTSDVMMAARLLTAMAGSDPLDAATAEADARKQDYAALLAADSAGLKGMRIGVMRSKQGDNAEIIALFDAALERMKRAGAVLVTIPELGIDQSEIGKREFALLLHELKRDMAAYLASLPADSPVKERTLADLIAFNKANAAQEMQYFGQDTFELAEAGTLICPADKKPCDAEAEYRRMAAEAKQMAGKDGIDRLLAQYQVDVLTQPSRGPAWLSTLGKGDNSTGPYASQLPAVAGYPHITVPMGATKEGRPIGLSFIGPQWADGLVLRAGYAFEKAGPSLKVAPPVPAPVVP